MNAALFKVKQSALKAGSQELRQYRNMLCSVSASVEEARHVMSGMKGGVTAVCGSLSRIESKIGKCEGNIGSMADALEDIAELYGNTEGVLTENIKNSAKTQGRIPSDSGIPVAISDLTSAGWLGYKFNENHPGITAWIGKASAEIRNDSAYIGVNGYLGKGSAEIKADGGFMKYEIKEEYKNGEWTEKESLAFITGELGAEASVLAIAGDIKTGIGNDMLGAETKIEGTAGNAKAGVKGKFLIGEEGVNINTSGEAMVSAVEGKASGTINILGFEITGKVGGYAGAAGVKGKIGIENNKFVFEGGVAAAAVIGCSAGIEIGFNDEGWDNFVDFITFWD